MYPVLNSGSPCFVVYTPFVFRSFSMIGYREYHIMICWFPFLSVYFCHGSVAKWSRLIFYPWFDHLSWKSAYTMYSGYSYQRKSGVIRQGEWLATEGISLRRESVPFVVLSPKRWFSFPCELVEWNRKGRSKEWTFTLYWYGVNGVILLFRISLVHTLSGNIRYFVIRL